MKFVTELLLFAREVQKRRDRLIGERWAGESSRLSTSLILFIPGVDQLLRGGRHQTSMSANDKKAC